jgi:hypothetical protein
MTLFEGALKNITNIHKCDNIFTDFVFLSFLGIYFSKKIVKKYSTFRKLCQLLMIFHPKKLTNIYYSICIVYEFGRGKHLTLNLNMIHKDITLNKVHFGNSS